MFRMFANINPDKLPYRSYRFVVRCWDGETSSRGVAPLIRIHVGWVACSDCMPLTQLKDVWDLEASRSHRTYARAVDACMQRRLAAKACTSCFGVRGLQKPSMRSGCI